MLDSIRTRLYGALKDKTGNGFAPIRLAKSAVLYANDVVGRPLATADELTERRELETAAAGDNESVAVTEAAPVVVFHIERQPNEVEKIGGILKGEGIEFTVRNISDDEAAISAAKMDSEFARFPMVFIAGDYIGGAMALTNMISSGDLRRRVFGK